jgi:hypothetical protein
MVNAEGVEGVPLAKVKRKEMEADVVWLEEPLNGNGLGSKNAPRGAHPGGVRNRGVQGLFLDMVKRILHK